MRGTLVAVTSGEVRRTVVMDNNRSAVLYADHPSSEEIRDYLHLPVTLVLDTRGTVRDFYSESDATYPVREAASNAGVFPENSARYDNRRREKLKTFVDVLRKFGERKSTDPIQMFMLYPYVVMRTPSDDRPFGLDAASSIAANLGLPRNVRCRGELEYDIVRKADKGDPSDYASGGGHTCYPADAYFKPMLARYGFETVQAELAYLVANGRLVFDEDRAVVASPKAVKYRDAIVDYLTSAVSMYASEDATSDDETPASDDDLTPVQAEAVARARVAAVSVVVGPAGTGKTRVVQAIKRSVKGVWLCAPTGKAARRMGGDARTVHSFLATFDPKADSNQRARARSDGPQAHDLVVVDEASMLDFTIAYLLFKLAADRGLRLLFVGDPFQLPSVEWGTVLDDLVEWARPRGCLVELVSVFRQGEESGLLKLATSIREGTPVTLYSLPDVEYATFETEEDMVASVARLWETCQIITPTNKVRDAVNLKAIGRRDVDEGDKVICLRNQEISEAKNGDIGWLVGFEYKVCQADEKSKRKRKQKVAMFTLEDADPPVVYEALAKDVAHAYAITVHKSQGSEWDCVCLAVKYVGGTFLNKKLVYTAITRAKKKLVVAGVGKSFFRGVNIDAPRRHSLGL